jgi:hypothetical protein
MHCTVSCWILGEYGDRGRVSNRGEGLNLIKAQYIQTWSTKAKPPWIINVHIILKNEGQVGKINLFWG